MNKEDEYTIQKEREYYHINKKLDQSVESYKAELEALAKSQKQTTIIMAIAAVGITLAMVLIFLSTVV